MKEVKPGQTKTSRYCVQLTLADLDYPTFSDRGVSLVLLLGTLWRCHLTGSQRNSGVLTIEPDNIYCQISNISRTLVGNKIVDHSYVVGASPVGWSNYVFLHSQLNTWLQSIGQTDDTKNMGAAYIRSFMVHNNKWYLLWKTDLHDDLMIPHHWPFVRGIHRSAVDSHHKG